MATDDGVELRIAVFRGLALAGFVAVVVATWALAADTLGPAGLVGLAVVSLIAIVLTETSRVSHPLTPLRLRQRRRLLRRLERALDEDEIVLAYQPQIDLAEGTVLGVEALVRWRRGERLAPPAEFLSQVEGSALIGPLTDRVLERAVSQAASWHEEGWKLRVAVNLSTANLRDFQVARKLEGLLAAYELPGELLAVEVTETAVLDEPETARAVLDQIAAFGVAISLDDFGIGYSSLLRLQAFPVDEVKIDRSFISTIDGDEGAFVQGVVQLAEDLGLGVVAEGVETEEALAALHEVDCPRGQGFLFARPMSASDLKEWLLENALHPEWRRPERSVSLQPLYGEIDGARDRIVAELSEMGIEDDALWDLRVIITEALANAIQHGPMREDGLVQVRMKRGRSDLRMEIQGGGNREISARGLGVITELAGELDLRRDKNSSSLVLRKRLDGAGGEADRPPELEGGLGSLLERRSSNSSAATPSE